MNRGESHLVSAASGSPLPGKEEFSVALCDVRLAVDSQTTSSLVNPERRPFNLSKETDGRFIQDDVARAVAPLRPKFFVAERRTVTECQQYFFKLCAIVNSGLSLDPSLVLGHLALGLVGQQPAVSILAQAQQFAAFS